jgi:hypothetical protein
MKPAGVPQVSLEVANRTYFDYHHTAADTLDKVDPQNLKRHVALVSLWTWYLANMEQPLGRASAAARQ